MTRRMSRRFFHVPRGVPYSVENSFVGIWAAWLLKLLWIDVDLHVTKDGVIVASHWAHPRMDGFILPAWFKAKYGPDPMIRDILWADLSRLRTPVRSYRGKTFVNQYRTAKEMMAEAVRRRRAIEFEPKGDKAFQDVSTWQQLDADRAEVGLPRSRVNVKTLTNIAGWQGRLRAASAAGLTTIVLPRYGAAIPRSAEQYIDYVRGSWKRGPVGS